MSLLLDITSWICIVSGSFLLVIGGIGIIRLPDFYSRLHGGGITDTMGAGLLMTGLMVQSVESGLSPILQNGLAGGIDAGPWLITVKLVMILFFFILTSPTACYALASSAMAHKVKPLHSGKEEDDSILNRLSNTMD